MFHPQYPINWVCLAHTCNAKTWEVDNAGSEIQSRFLLQREFEANQSQRACLKIKGPKQLNDITFLVQRVFQTFSPTQPPGHQAIQLGPGYFLQITMTFLCLCDSIHSHHEGSTSFPRLRHVPWLQPTGASQHLITPHTAWQLSDVVRRVPIEVE